MARTRGGGHAGGHVPRLPPIASARRECETFHAEQPPQHSYSRLVKSTRSKRQRIPKGSYPMVSIRKLPRDLLVEVVATAASRSFVDLQAIKMCCKDFLDAAEDSHVWRNVSLDKFPLIQWLPNDKELSFLNRCRDFGNVESLYREGLRKYFNYPNENIDGLRILKAAAQMGHTEAIYVCGMISFCSDDGELRKQGLEYMRFLRNSKCVLRSRKKVEQLLKFMWKSNTMLERNQSPLCNSKSTCKGWKVKRGKWVLVDDDDDDDDISLCEYCRWDHELEFFYRLFNIH